MRKVELTRFGLDGVQLSQAQEVAPQAGQVAVRMHAASLNYHDLATALGFANPKMPLPQVPLSDGGELRLVTFAWSLPDGRSIEGWGLTPDVPIRWSGPVPEMDLIDAVMNSARDPVLSAALAGLRRTLGDDLTDGPSPGDPPPPANPER